MRSTTLHTISRQVSRLALLALVAVPLSCGDDDPAAPTLVAADNTVLAANATVVEALTGVTFNFAGGAGALSPALAGQDLALTFGGSATTPTAGGVITSPTGTVLGSFEANVSFGSCIFVVSGSTFPPGSALAVGQLITVNPCNVNIGTAGAVANGVAQSRSIALILGSASSSNQSVTVGVNAGGQLIMNGKQVGTITLTPVSG